MKNLFEKIVGEAKSHEAILFELLIRVGCH